MRTHAGMAIALCAAASLGAAMGAAPAVPAASPTFTQAAKRQTGQPVIIDCLWHPRVRPAQFVLACGDGNSLLHSLHWSRWAPKSAVARGFNEVNDCKPYCAAGTFHSYAVIVRLDHPKPWKRHPHLRQYTRMNIVYTGGRPEGFRRVVTYPLWN